MTTEKIFVKDIENVHILFCNLVKNVLTYVMSDM